MKRRDFIENTCLLCGAIALGGIATQLSACSTPQNFFQATMSSGMASVPLNTLQNESTKIVKVEGLKDNLLLVKKEGQQYIALQMKCTHKGAGLKQEYSDLKCTLHGSRFDMDGKVTKGPAKENLKVFNTKVEGENIIIQLS